MLEILPIIERQTHRLMQTGLPCVYALVTPDSMVYIGSSRSIGKRLAVHFSYLRTWKHPCASLQEAWDKGLAITPVVLEVAELDLLLEREQLYIDLFDAANPAHGYNVCPTARKGGVSDATRRKLSLSNAKGEEHHNAVLTWSNVRLIRAYAKEGLSRRQLAEEFSVSKRTIAQVVLGLTWKENRDG